MADIDQKKFAQEVVDAAFQIELADALGSAKEAQSFPLGGGKSGKVSKEELALAKAHAKELLRRRPVIERLCPALRSASDDLGEIAKILAAAAIPLTLGPQAVLSATPLALGAVAVVVARMGVRALCPEEKSGKDASSKR